MDVPLRLCAHLRLQFPLLRFAIAVALAQLFVLLLAPWMAFVVLLFVVLLGLRIGRKYPRDILCGFVVGWVSIFPMFLGPGDLSLSEQRSLEGFIASRPSRSVPGRVSFSVVLPKRNAKVRCTAPDVPWRDVGKLEIGQLIRFRGTFSPVGDSYIFGYDGWLRRSGHVAKCKILFLQIDSGYSPSFLTRFRKVLSRMVADVSDDDEAISLYLSMVLGKRDVLTPESEKAYQRTGLAHLLVVSGFQVTLLYYSVVAIGLWIASRLLPLVSYVRIDIWLRIAGLITATAYYLLVGADSSTNRAEIALIFLALGQTLERGGGLWNSILLAFVFMVILFPGCFFDPGVQLTFAALIGIALGQSSRNRKRFVMMEFIRVCFLASMLTSFVCAIWFRTLSLSGFFLNILLAPVFSVVSCQFGIPALMAFGSGVDTDGWLLRVCLETLSYLHWIVVELSKLSFAAVVLSEDQATFCLVAFGILGIFVIRRTLHDYVMHYNLQSDSREATPRK